jgi:hypothetical protein
LVTTFIHTLATIKMKKTILTLLILFLGLTINAQTYSKKDFVKTDWFTENIDSLFFEVDTIRLIQYNNYGPEWDKDENAEYEMKYFDHGDYLNFCFERFGHFEYWATYDNYMNSVPIADFIWKFDKKDQILTVFMDNEIYFKLKPLSKRQIEIESGYAEQEELLTTNELTLIKIK